MQHNEAVMKCPVCEKEFTGNGWAVDAEDDRRLCSEECVNKTRQAKPKGKLSISDLLSWIILISIGIWLGRLILR
jgi:hypothetical protein